MLLRSRVVGRPGFVRIRSRDSVGNCINIDLTTNCTGIPECRSQNLSYATIGALALISLSLPSTALSQGAFLKNLQPLDDEIRGYCLDVRRAPPNVDLEGRLGTHACKYGLENVDQQFEWRAPDQLYLPEYDRCLTTAGFDVGAELFARSLRRYRRAVLGV